MKRMVLVRHGTSEFNADNRFTGWANPPLSSEGYVEAQTAGEMLSVNLPRVDLACCSPLARARETLDLILRGLAWPEPFPHSCPGG